MACSSSTLWVSMSLTAAGASGPEAESEEAKEPWEPPAELELVKELNGHTGRLATLVGFVLTAVSVSLA